MSCGRCGLSRKVGALVKRSKELCKQSAGRAATARRLREPVSARGLFNLTQQAE
jgi:hypothetical protein